MSIFGFNTDVESNGILYHVMTEPRTGAQEFQSLVFQKGVLIAKRTVDYGHRSEAGDDQALHQLLKKQHSSVVHALREGHIDDCFKDIEE
jgi:hypothetical protein